MKSLALVLLLSSLAGAAMLPRPLCVARCAPVIEAQCTRHVRACIRRMIRKCRHGRAVCPALATTSSTTSTTSTSSTTTSTTLWDISCDEAPNYNSHLYCCCYVNIYGCLIYAELCDNIDCAAFPAEELCTRYPVCAPSRGVTCPG